MKRKNKTRDLMIVALAVPILVFIVDIISQRFIGDPDVDFGSAIGLAVTLAVYGGAVYS